MSKKLIGKITVVTTDSQFGEFEDDTFEGGLKVGSEPEKVVTYKRDGNTVYCTIECDGFSVTGVARCNPADTFILSAGCALAETRARQKFYHVAEEELIKLIAPKEEDLFEEMLRQLSESLS